jgi:hypothetical protein
VRVIVIGAGIAGSAMGRALRDRGADVTIVAAGCGQARAAIALTRSTWLPREQRSLLLPALAAYRAAGAPMACGAWVTSFDRQGLHQDDWWALDPLALLVPADVVGAAVGAGQGQVIVGGQELVGDRVVWATADPSWGKVTYGVTWRHPDPAALAFSGLRVDRMAPYRTMAGVAWGHGARIGSSNAAGLDTARRQAQRMLARAESLGWLARGDGWEPIEGRRVLAPMALERISGGAYRWGGFHRSGYVLAPALAGMAADEVLAG